MPVIAPQPGPQLAFLSTPADIAIMGGGNDGGKTFGSLMDCVRHAHNPNFEAIYFRRETPNITNPGGLWDEAKKMYGRVATAITSPRHQLKFPSGARITFAHLQHETDKYSYDGSQIPGIYFDQLEQFTESQFWHMFGRNRSTCGVVPYIRATCNPLPKSWLAELIRWYWDPETGYAIPERSGVIRYFVRDMNGDKILWGDTREELAGHVDEAGEPLPVISFTFILALIHDNKIALAKDPTRLARLMSLPFVEKERRLKGNWKIEDVTGDGLFKPEWWKMLDVAVWQSIAGSSSNWRWSRGWDPAGGQSPGSDYSSGGLVGIAKDPNDKRTIIADITRGQWSPHVRNEMIKATLLADLKFEPFSCFWKSRTPDVNTNITNAVKGIWAIPERGRKFYRAYPLAVEAEAGNVWLAPGAWVADFVREASQFKDEDSTDVRKDDQVDCVSLAYAQVTKWHPRN